METKAIGAYIEFQHCISEYAHHHVKITLFFVLGYGSNTLTGMTKASLDPHGHLRQPGKQILKKKIALLKLEI